ncbi:unnamed protein product [Diabrotica balteata]|uniref:Centriolar and ciliogenesis-associated protein HYLS1 C-terminal domain-containing protein n=1 Tax=Diabrotica balteata TaxID=107213 RepID=A0A9N9T5M4_DIABA|nr:unnamed protein product [Diabrotica balteata]
MPNSIDPKEVLIYLNELGYTNLSAQQLKEFIMDLKKIMKYDRRKRKVEAHFDPTESYSHSTPIFPDIKQKPRKTQSNDIFETLHNLPTEASKAKMVNKRAHQIEVHITHAKNKNVNHEHCVHIEDNSPSNDALGVGYNKIVESTEKHSKENIQTQPNSSEPSTTKQLRPMSKQSVNSSSVPSSKLKKSKTAVLKNKSNIKPIRKSDPVALYHQYQEEWKNIKFPGEDNHLDLRWAVREKLMDGPPIEKPVKRITTKKKAF